MENSKISFLKQIILAITKPKEYKKLSKVKGGRLVGFVFLLVLITTILSPGITFVKTVIGSEDVISSLYNNAPDFSLQEGEFYIEEPYEFKDIDSNSYILLDSDVAFFERKDIDPSFDTIILISKTNIIIYTDSEIKEYTLDVFDFMDINKESLLSLKPIFTVILGFGFVIVYFALVSWYFFSSLLYSIIGVFVSNVTKSNLSFGTIFKMAVYSKVTIKILYAILNLANISISNNLSNLIAIAVTSIYLVMGILSYKSTDEVLDDTDQVSSSNNDSSDDDSVAW